ncbi:MAG: hypothetical protein AAGL66_09565, partial [Pseudomonadota bacterium]
MTESYAAVHSRNSNPGISGSAWLLAWALASASLLVANSALALTYSKELQETASELVEQLEERHYSKRPYDGELASEHLDAYLDDLDGGRMFFTAADIASFEDYREKMEGELHAGRLDAGFSIFNRFHERLIARLE